MSFDDSANNRQAQPRSFGFCRGKNRSECAFLQFFTHAFAGIFKFHGDMCWVRTFARQTNFARLYGECPAVWHGFGCVENQIQKCLFELRSIAHDRRQISLQITNQLDFLICKLVADEQTQFINQFIQIHRREFWFRCARKIQNLLHDFIQMFDFCFNDARVFCARIAGGKFQIQRVIKQFHHRERIADFVRDFGGQKSERG